MNVQQRGLVAAFATDDLTEEAFIAEFGVQSEAFPAFLFRELEGAITLEDAELVEDLLLMGEKCGILQPSLAPVLAKLLLQPWHYHHEDLARMLQRFRDPNTVDALAAAARTKPAYLAAVDDAHALARKCIWALSDIGTAAALGELCRLAAHEDEEVAGYAWRRIERWELERGRKLGG